MQCLVRLNQTLVPSPLMMWFVCGSFSQWHILCEVSDTFPNQLYCSSIAVRKCFYSKLSKIQEVNKKHAAYFSVTEQRHRCVGALNFYIYSNIECIAMFSAFGWCYIFYISWFSSPLLYFWKKTEGVTWFPFLLHLILSAVRKQNDQFHMDSDFRLKVLNRLVIFIFKIFNLIF